MAEDKLIGLTTGSYKIERKIGGGGMGVVYQARDTRLGRSVALKLIRSDQDDDGDLRVRLEREARHLSSLNHPNIVTIYDIGESDYGMFLCEEFIDGTDLQRELQNGPMPAARWTEIALKIAGALQAAHDAEILHRDLTPRNVLLDSTGRVKVVDFGLAKTVAKTSSRAGDTESGQRAANLEVEAETMPALTRGIVGTSHHMSPEQILGQPVDARTDIFQLGILIFYMATGRLPFEGGDLIEVMHKIVHKPRAETGDGMISEPDSFSAMLDRALAKKPADRYSSMNELAVDLESYRQAVLGTSSPLASTSPAVPVIVTETPSSAKKRRVPLTLTLGLLLLIAVLATVGLQSFFSGPPKLAVVPFSVSEGFDFKNTRAETLTESTLESLWKIREFEVTRSGSTLNPEEDEREQLEEVARTTGADVILVGQIFLLGDDYRVYVRLLDSSDFSFQWSNSFELRNSTGSKIPQEIARQIASEYGVSLSSEEESALLELQSKTETPGEHNEMAFYHLSLVQANVAGRESLETAWKEAQIATEMEPENPIFWNTLGLTESALGNPTEALAHFEEASNRSEAFDGGVYADADYNLAYTLEDLGWWAEATPYYARAIEAETGFALAHNGRVFNYFVAGFFSEEEFEDSRRGGNPIPVSGEESWLAEPGSSWTHVRRAEMLKSADGLAAAALKIVPSADPDRAFLLRTHGRIQLAGNSWDRAVQSFEESAALNPLLPSLDSLLAVGYEAQGKKHSEADALRLIARNLETQKLYEKALQKWIMIEEKWPADKEAVEALQRLRDLGKQGLKGS